MRGWREIPSGRHGGAISEKFNLFCSFSQFFFSFPSMRFGSVCACLSARRDIKGSSSVTLLLRHPGWIWFFPMMPVSTLAFKVIFCFEREESNWKLRDIKNCKGIVGIWIELRDEAQRNAAVKIWQTFRFLSAQWHYMSVNSKYQKSNWNELMDCRSEWQEWPVQY